MAIAPVSDRRVNVNVSFPLSNAGVNSQRLKRHAMTAWLSVMTFLSLTLNPPKGIVKKLREIPLTVAGLACIDFAVFHVGHGWGWLATGISLMALEHMIADEE